jgi:hypothetical protein
MVWREHHCHAFGDEIQRVPSPASPPLFNAQAGGSASSRFFLLATKSRGWYRFTLNRLVSLAYLRCVPFWRAPGGTRTHVSGNCWVRLSWRRRPVKRRNQVATVKSVASCPTSPTPFTKQLEKREGGCWCVWRGFRGNARDARDSRSPAC